MMTNSVALWSQRIPQFDIAIDADQAEWAAIQFGISNIDEGIRDNVMGGELRDPLEIESRASNVADEVKRRKAVLGLEYPFKIKENSLEYRPSSNSVYEFCLSISFVPSLSTRFGKQFQISFERLTRDVLKCYLGKTNVMSYRTGMPGDTVEKRPGRIKGIIDEISKMCRKSEWIWRPDDGFPKEPKWNEIGDLGMDVVAWREFEDQRCGHMFLLAQCACGLTDWDSKFDEPNYGRIKSWVGKISNVPFVKVFAIPFHIPNDPHFGEVTRQVGGIVFDRARLVMIANAHSAFILRSAPVTYLSLVNAAQDGHTVARSRWKKRRKKK